MMAILRPYYLFSFFPHQLERKAEVAKELKHTARHTGKYVNTSTWNAGVRQRMETKQLYEHLAKEYRTLKVVLMDAVPVVHSHFAPFWKHLNHWTISVIYLSHLFFNFAFFLSVARRRRARIWCKCSPSRKTVACACRHG